MNGEEYIKAKFPRLYDEVLKKEAQIKRDGIFIETSPLALEICQWGLESSGTLFALIRFATHHGVPVIFLPVIVPGEIKIKPIPAEEPSCQHSADDWTLNENGDMICGKCPQND